MREILFRGKRKDSGEWVEGRLLAADVIVPCQQNFILEANCLYEGNKPIIGYEVDEETVGQFTGLTDKNGKKIFEGDILSVTVRESFKECGIRKFTGRKIKTVWSVEYAERHAQGNGFFAFGIDRRFSLRLTKSVICNATPEIIGNIHDNHELLEGAEK